MAQRKYTIYTDGKVKTHRKIAHRGVAARPARGMTPAVRVEAAAMLASGLKPIQVASRFSAQERDPVSIPLLEQLQALNSTLKYQYPNMDTVHDCNVAYASSLVVDQETWEKGLDTDLKILGIVEHRRTVDGIEIVEPVIVFTCRKVAGNVIPAMEAWGGRVPFRTDGTFRLTRMYVRFHHIFVINYHNS